MRSEDLSDLFTAPNPALPVGPVAPTKTRQGTILRFDPVTGENTVQVGTELMSNIPVDVVGAVPLADGHVVQIDTTTPSWFIKGRVSDPGAGVVPTWVTDIESAQTSADGKNKIYRQGSEPAAGALGDTWFDSDDGNKIYIHDGTSWVASELGTSAILDLAINNAKIGNLDVGKLTTGSLTADVTLSSILSTRLDGTGAGVDLGPFGIVTYAADGSPRTQFPSDPTLPDTFKGNIEATAATFTGGVSFAPGSASTVERGAVLTLASGVTDPQQAPSVTIDWESLALPAANHGMGLVWKDSTWWTAEWSGVAAYLVQYSPTTGLEVARTLLSGGTGPYIPGGGLAWNGTNWYVLGQSQADGNWYLLRYNTSGVFQNGSQYAMFDTNDGWFYAQYNISKFSIAYRASTGNIVIGQYDTSSSAYALDHRDPTSCAHISYSFTPNVSGFGIPVGGLAFGNFDYGSERMALTSRNNGTVWIFNPASSYAYSATESFPAASGQTTGLAFDGSNFFVSRIFPGVSTIYKHTAMTWTATADGNWWVPYTWYDSNATGGNHESAMSPAANFTMKKRARFTITTPAIPVGGADDPDSVRVFVGRGTTLPARTAMWVQSAFGGAVQTFTTLTIAGANPPAASNYPVSASPGLAKNPAGTLQFSGDGSAAVNTLAIGGVNVYAPILIRKAATQTVTNSVTLVLDTHLRWPALANTSYIVQVSLFVGQNASATTPKFQVGVSVPSGTWSGFGFGPPTSATNAVFGQLVDFSALYAAAGSTFKFGVDGDPGDSTGIQLNLMVDVGATGGTVALQWAQNVAVSGIGTQVKAGSWIRIERV